MSDMTSLKVMLNSNDWTYEMSDDMSAYSKGKQNDQACRRLAKELGAEGIKLYNEYYMKYAYPKDDILE